MIVLKRALVSHLGMVIGSDCSLSGLEGRRRLSGEGWLHILVESFQPGACVADVARRHDVSTALVYTWPRKLRQPVAEPDFAEAVVVSGYGAAAPIASPGVIVELARGIRVSIFASALPCLAAAALKALR